MTVVHATFILSWEIFTSAILVTGSCSWEKALCRPSKFVVSSFPIQTVRQEDVFVYSNFVPFPILFEFHSDGMRLEE